MNVLFVGGPGRSGTSFVSDRLGQHGSICTFKDVELKIFCEKNGLLDLYHSLCEQYSPNRGPAAMQQFQRMVNALIEGQYGQRPLNAVASRDVWHRIFSAFSFALSGPGHVGRCEQERFVAASRVLLQAIADVAARQDDQTADAHMFLEKTPHALLAIDFLRRLAPEARFLHVMRDPRSIAFSLQRMHWAPDSLAECCDWVVSYCESWMTVRGNAPDGALVDIRIEDVACRPEEWSGALCDWLSLEHRTDLFARADPATLNGWAARCSAVDMDLLESRLGKWAQTFGYRAAEIGATSLTPCTERSVSIAVR